MFVFTIFQHLCSKFEVVLQFYIKNLFKNISGLLLLYIPHPPGDGGFFSPNPPGSPGPGDFFIQNPPGPRGWGIFFNHGGCHLYYRLTVIGMSLCNNFREKYAIICDMDFRFGAFSKTMARFLIRFPKIIYKKVHFQSTKTRTHFFAKYFTFIYLVCGVLHQRRCRPMFVSLAQLSSHHSIIHKQGKVSQRIDASIKVAPVQTIQILASSTGEPAR